MKGLIKKNVAKQNIVRKKGVGCGIIRRVFRSCLISSTMPPPASSCILSDCVIALSVPTYCFPQPSPDLALLLTERRSTLSKDGIWN